MQMNNKFCYTPNYNNSFLVLEYSHIIGVYKKSEKKLVNYKLEYLFLSQLMFILINQKLQFYFYTII